MSGVEYGIDEIDEPLHSLLVAAGVDKVSHEDYNTLAVTDTETAQQYLESYTSDPENYSWENIMYTMHSAAVEAGLLDAEEGEAEEEYDAEAAAAEEAAYAAEQAGAEGPEDELQYYDTTDGQLVLEDSTGQAVHADEEEADGEAAHDDAAEEGGDEVAPETDGMLEIESGKMGDRSLALRARFLVTKRSYGAVFTSKKEKLLEIDFFARELRAYDTNTKALTAKYEAQHFFRCERWAPASDPRALRIQFFKRPHPLDVTFRTAGERHRFIQLMVFMRRAPVVWAPSVAPALQTSGNEHVVKLIGTTLQQGRHVVALKPQGQSQTFTVSKLPYEIIRMFVGCMDLKGGVPPSGLSSFVRPNDADICVVGALNVPAALRSSDALAKLVVEALGTTFYPVLCSLSETNHFAGLDHHRGDSQMLTGVVLAVKRAVLPKVGNVDFYDVVRPMKTKAKAEHHGGAMGTFVSFRVQESSVAVLITKLDEGMEEVHQRNEALADMLGHLRPMACGKMADNEEAAAGPDPEQLVDVTQEFDYFTVAGQLCHNDYELTQQVKSQAMLTDFVEATNLIQSADPAAAESIPGAGPIRVLQFARPKTAKAVPSRYGTCAALPAAMAHRSLTSDLYMMRPFCSSICVTDAAAAAAVGAAAQPVVQGFRLTEMLFDCDALTGAKKMEAAMYGEWIASRPGGALRAKHPVIPLTTRGQRFVASNVGVVAPVAGQRAFLEAQTLVVSLYGEVPKVTKKRELVGSACIPLREMLKEAHGASTTVSANLVRRGTVIGVAELTFATC